MTTNNLRFIASLFAVLLLAGCSDDDNSEPPAELIEFSPTAEVDELWSVSPNDGSGQHFVYLEPLLLGDRIVSAGRDGRIAIVDLIQGDISRDIDLDIGIGAGVGGDDGTWLVADQNGHVVAIDPETDELLWRKNVNSEVLTRPVVFGDTVYVRTIDGRLISLERDSGQSNWEYSKVLPALTLRGNAAPILTRDWVILTRDDGHIVALEHASGKVVWDVEVSAERGRSEIERLNDIDGSAQLFGRVLYVGGFQGGLAAIDMEQGRVLWARDFSTYSGVTVDEEVLYVTDERSHVWAIDRFSGATLWKQDSLTARAVTRPVLFGEYLLAGDYAGFVHIMKKSDGSFVAREAFGDEDDGIFLPPLVIGESVIVVNRGGDITAFDIQQLDIEDQDS